MKENLIEYRIFKVGDRVKIIPNTRFYKGGPLESNPKDVGGSITKIEDDWHSVKWDNGRTNGYEVNDLIYEGEDKTVIVNANRIYLPSTPETVEELFGILYQKAIGGIRTCETYYIDTKTNQQVKQCSAGRMRSFDDIWIMCDTYFPEIDIREVFKKLMLWNVRLEDIERGVIPKQLSNCSTMQRIRYTNGLMSIRQIWGNIDCAHFKSVYKWRDLFNMIYINSEEQLKDWYLRELKEVKQKTEV